MFFYNIFERLIESVFRSKQPYQFSRILAPADSLLEKRGF